MLPEMDDKNADIAAIAEKALADSQLLSSILEGLTNKNETLRYNCHKVLMTLSREHGGIVYPNWDYIVEQLSSSNTYHRLTAVSILAVLAAVDKDNRFDEIFDKYFGLLGDKGTIPAIYVARNAGKIAVAKPHLREAITDRLLGIEKIYKGKQPELTKSAIIEAFDEFYEESESRERIREFVSSQLGSESPKTKKAAKAFIDKWG
ncbi:hypothetical protein ACFLYQ_07270 [Chloroflexota bacterium]